MARLRGTIAVIVLIIASTPSFANETAIETIAYEASGEDLLGQVAVACVIRNRAEKQNKTIEQICKAPYQFSCWNPKTKLNKRTKLEIEKARLAWQLSESFLFSATHYHALNCNPYWSKSLTYLCTIGNHKFYQQS